MEKKLKAYVRSRFRKLPKTARTLEICEEICADVVECYRDLRKSGTAPREAYEIAKRSVGDIREIVDVSEEAEVIGLRLEHTRKRSAFVGSAAALYILGPALQVASVLFNPAIGLVLLLVCVAAATGLCVYGCSVYPKVVPQSV